MPSREGESCASVTRNRPACSCFKAQGTLEKRLAPLGFSVKWVSFQPARSCSKDSTSAQWTSATWASAPIFAQAGRQVRLASTRPGRAAAEAIRVEDSSLRSVAELKGKKVALNRGGNVHYLL
jgi:sulfonate transport system substrate-binding protein